MLDPQSPHDIMVNRGFYASERRRRKPLSFCAFIVCILEYGVNKLRARNSCRKFDVVFLCQKWAPLRLNPRPPRVKRSRITCPGDYA